MNLPIIDEFGTKVCSQGELNYNMILHAHEHKCSPRRQVT